MKIKKRILIAGLGGVGGYLGAKLAFAYTNSDEVEIIFLARGNHLTAMQKDGIKLLTDTEEIIANPFLITDNAGQIGKVDYIVCSMKNYDLEATIEQLKPCIDSETVILPILNGVEASSKIKSILPGIEVWEGCIYIVSRIHSPGVIAQKGDANAIFFGSTDGNSEKLKELDAIFKKAKLNSRLSENIDQIIWEKFIFISAIASLTSYLNLGIGTILQVEGHKEVLLKLLGEVKSIALYKKISISENIIETIITRLSKLPGETTSSMQLDFSKGNKTELSSLTGYVIRMGKEYHIPTPTYQKLFDTLSKY